MLVIDEAFDSWKSKKVAHDYGDIWDQHWEADLQAFVRRDRNHPSVIMWSIGNEVYERGQAAGIMRAHELAAVVRELDRDRPVTIGLNGLGESGDWSQLDTIFAAMDAAGYNYELADRHAADHQRRPNRVMYASESYQREAFANWALMAKHPHIIGDFVWSAMDYLGEAGIGRVFPPDEEPRAHWEGEHFPWHGAVCGDLDLIGDRKPISHYRQIVWDRGEKLFAAVQVPSPAEGSWNPSQWALHPVRSSWTWPGHEGKPLQVEVYSRWDAVRIMVNGREVAQALTGVEEAFKAVVEIPYEPGTLMVEGIRGQEVVDTFSLQTAGEPARLELQANTFSTPMPSAHTLSFVEVTVTDEDGIHHPMASPLIHYTLEGPCEIIGIGSGDLTSRQSYQANPRIAANGRALVIIRHIEETGAGGPMLLKARAEGLKSVKIEIPKNPRNP
jgi:beta-galactosidase